MWETIADVFTSTNAPIVRAFLLFMGIMAWAMAKKGLFNIHTDAVTIGAADKERKIVRLQMEWVYTHLSGLEANIEKGKGYDRYRGKYVIERVYDYYVDRITQNHITNSTEYIEICQSNILAIVDSLTEKPAYKSDEFKRMLLDDTKHCIEKLIQIRKVYQ